MKLIVKSFVIAVVLSLGAQTALAKSLAGKSFRPTAKVGDAELKLNGVGMRLATFLNVKVYAAGLYVPVASKDPATLLKDKGPFRLVLKFVRDVGQGKMEDAFEEGFKKNGHGKFAKKGKKLATYMGDVAENDVVKLTFTPGKGSSVSKNGKWLGKISGDDFGRALLSVWIGKNPPNKELKQGLLGR